MRKAGVGVTPLPRRHSKVGARTRGLVKRTWPCCVRPEFFKTKTQYPKIGGKRHSRTRYARHAFIETDHRDGR